MLPRAKAYLQPNRTDGTWKQAARIQAAIGIFTWIKLQFGQQTFKNIAPAEAKGFPPTPAI